MNKITLLLVALLMLSEISFAQEEKEEEKSEFKISAQYRARGEYRDGYKVVLTEDQSGLPIISQRMRLMFDYKNDKIETKISVQDVRSWGQTPVVDFGKTQATTPIMVKEAWAKYKFNDNFGIKLGRSQLRYGDSRLLWCKDWSNYGASHDVAILQYKKSGLLIDFGFTSNATNDWKYNFIEADDYIVSNYKNMLYLFASKKLGDALTINFMDVARGYQKLATPETVYVSNSVGLNPVFKSNGIKFDGSFYYQMGKVASGADLSAYMYTANLSYKLNSFNLGAGYDAYSGKAFDDTDPEVKKFQTCEYGGHKFLGSMDFFLTLPEAGINDINVKLSYSLSKTTSFALAFHNLNLINDWQIAGNTIDKALGNEIDISFKHKLAKGVVLVGGYSTYLTTESFEELKGVGAGNSKNLQWAWMMINFTPTFFVSK